MKAIENKKIRITVPDQNEEQGYRILDYADLIANAVNQVPQGGVNPAEMKKRLSILKSLDKIDSDPNNMIVLEDADAAKLKELVRVAKWPNIHEDITAFTDEVCDIKSEEAAREEAIKRQAEEAEKGLKVVDQATSTDTEEAKTEEAPVAEATEAPTEG